MYGTPRITEDLFLASWPHCSFDSQSASTGSAESIAWVSAGATLMAIRLPVYCCDHLRFRMTASRRFFFIGLRGAPVGKQCNHDQRQAKSANDPWQIGNRNTTWCVFVNWADRHDLPGLVWIRKCLRCSSILKIELKELHRLQIIFGEISQGHRPVLG